MTKSHIANSHLGFYFWKFEIFLFFNFLFLVTFFTLDFSLGVQGNCVGGSCKVLNLQLISNYYITYFIVEIKHTLCFILSYVIVCCFIALCIVIHILRRVLYGCATTLEVATACAATAHVRIILSVTICNVHVKRSILNIRFVRLKI